MYTESSADTGELKWLHHAFEWVLTDAKSVWRKKVSFSPRFAHSMANIEGYCRIKLCPQRKPQFMNISLILTLEGDRQAQRVLFSILNEKNEKVNVYEAERIPSYELTKWQVKKFMSKFVMKCRDNEKLFEPKKKLRILCEMLLSDSVNESEPTSLESRTNGAWKGGGDGGGGGGLQLCGVSQISRFRREDQLHQLLFSERFSDVKFLVDGCEIHAHKNILAAASPVFAAMFSCDMQENATNRVIIQDIGSEVFRELVRFVYTGRIERLDRHAKELLGAADKYALTRLKDICERHLCSSIDSDNAVEYLGLADLYGVPSLKESCLYHISCHAHEIANKPDVFNSIADLTKNLVIEVLRNFVKSPKEDKFQSKSMIFDPMLLGAVLFIIILYLSYKYYF
ncbi:unnamed protein product [Trichogramma brassicae]|uniref:BTB domain-containing protein n=1 Tax=Trichogramma brassicae TaxID=86971 RepID=A0A6H5IAA4_9HYME|nr:unnamed protein product [Trichogramma brassicae]